MIRFLQQSDSRIIKAIFVVIIGVLAVAMVVYLIPGLTNGGVVGNDTYAEIYPHWYNKLFRSGETVSLQRVQQVARQQLQQRYPQYADNPMMLNFMTQQVGQGLVQQQILLVEAAKLGITANDADVRHTLQTGPNAEALYPGGKFIGQQQYEALVTSRLGMSVTDFEENIKHQIIIERLRALITASASVSDAEVRDAYRKANIKIKFDYAVISADDLRKTINPSDADLQAFFTKNAARYAKGVPEQRMISYFAFTPNQIPGGLPQPSQQEIQAYYNQHQQEYQVPEQARARHILIQVSANADAKTDAAARAKADDVLKQLKSGGKWDDLAKKYSDDPGSKDTGGELGFAQRGRMVPEFDKAIFSQPINEIDIVKSQYGYHIVQVEERSTAHTQSLADVLPTIQATLGREKSAQAEDSYAKQLTAEAAKNGLAATAKAHGLDFVTTQPTAQQGTIAALPDSTQLLAKAFTAKQGGAPDFAPTGEGYAIFQVTGIQASHAPTFDNWKSHILDDYREENLPSLLAQKTAELAGRAKGGDLAGAAKAVGATVKSSDLVGAQGQVPDFGQLGQVAPQLLDLGVGAVSGPINAGRTGVVAKILDKQEPSADEIQKSFDQSKEEMLRERQDEAFQLFVAKISDDYKKQNRIRVNTKAATPESGQ
jgi:peptidyl-prolyl cis-trans isomerase D